MHVAKQAVCGGFKALGCIMRQRGGIIICNDGNMVKGRSSGRHGVAIRRWGVVMLLHQLDLHIAGLGKRHRELRSHRNTAMARIVERDVPADQKGANA